ncbi:MAG: glyoxalase/bleomycin resistance/dioxygenase family protein [Alphaproteobacteria bacterium]|nr:glyoxalase/bleomycin resistance/dioxygenase family protein [Alphaproteobacteria bacterium]
MKPTFEIAVHGIVLGTEKYDECVEFYRDIIGLPVWYDKGHLICLRFGDGYLMIETGGFAHEGVKPNDDNPTMLRFNVVDVKAASDALIARGVDVEYKKFDWGEVGTFCDPDGNKCELKDATDPYFN